MPLGAFRTGTYFEGDIVREKSLNCFLVLFNKTIKPKELKGN
jgi:hypothetical protein